MSRSSGQNIMNHGRPYRRYESVRNGTWYGFLVRNFIWYDTWYGFRYEKSGPKIRTTYRTSKSRTKNPFHVPKFELVRIFGTERSSMDSRHEIFSFWWKLEGSHRIKLKSYVGSGTDQSDVSKFCSVLVRGSIIVWIRWTKFRDDIIKSKIQEIMQREFHKVMQIVTYVDTLLNVTVNFYLFWPRNEIQTYNEVICRLEAYIGNKLYWKHLFRLETKKIHWKQWIKIGNKIRRLETYVEPK